jgi:hypothetical protein
MIPGNHRGKGTLAYEGSVASVRYELTVTSRSFSGTITADEASLWEAFSSRSMCLLTLQDGKTANVIIKNWSPGTSICYVVGSGPFPLEG